MSAPIITFTRREDGAVWSMGDMGITALEGLDAAEIEIFTQKRGVGHGDLVTGRRMKSRSFTITARAKGAVLNRSLREMISRYLSYTYTYDVKISYNGSERIAEKCYLKAMKMPTENYYSPLTLTCTMYCQNPYLLEAGSLNGVNIASITPTFGFPYVMLRGVSNSIGYFNFDKKVTVKNNGVLPTYMKASMQARGTVTNPKLMRGSQYVQLNKTLNSGDIVDIDTEHRSVLLNGASAMSYLDTGSSFEGLRLEVGINEISYDASVGDNLLDVELYYYTMMQGV